MFEAFRRIPHIVTSSILSALGAKTFGLRTPVVPGTTDFTIPGGGATVFAVDNGMLPGAVPLMALGAAASTTDGGYIATIEANFVAAGTPVAGLTVTAVDGLVINSANILDAATNEQVETPGGEEVFALVHALTGSADGDVVAAAAAENLQFSFVYWSKAAVPVLTAYTLPAGDYYFEPKIHRVFVNASYNAFLVSGDPLPDLVTQVFHIPTFTGVLYTDFRLGDIVVADDTGELRVVGPAAWAHSPRYETINGATTLDHMDGLKAFILDSVGGVFTVDLPATPADMLDTPWRPVLAMGVGSTNAVTVDGNGNTLYVNGVAAVGNQHDLNAPGDSVLIFTDGAAYYIFSGGGGNIQRTPVTTATYDTTTGDSFLAVTRTLTGTCAIRLMDALLAIPGKLVWMKDEGLNADVNAITVTAESGQTIDGDPNWPIDGSGELYGFYHDGTNWFVM